MTTPSQEWKDRVTLGRSILLHKAPMIAHLLYTMDVYCDDRCGTAFTNCVDYIGIPEGFAFDTDESDYAFILAHEVCHKLFAHMEVSKAFGLDNPMLANIAQDFVINYILINGEKIKISDKWKPISFRDVVDSMSGKKEPSSNPDSLGFLYDPSLAGLSSLEIYNKLKSNIPDNSQEGGDLGKGIVGNDAKPQDEDGKAGQLSQEQQDTIRRDVVGAFEEQMRDKNREEAFGNLPAEFQRIYESLSDPKIAWEDELDQFVSSHISFGYTPTYQRLNKRKVVFGQYSPGFISRKVGRLCVMVDTSGSIGSKELGIVQTELSSLMSRKNIEAIDILYIDTKVCHAHTVENGNDVVLEPKGGGGTDFRPGFEWVENSSEEYVSIIYFTDGYGSFPDTEPYCPTMWIRFPDYSLGADEFPFGYVVDMEKNQ